MVTLTLTMGIPASGKTTYARLAAERTGAVLLSTDIIRTDRQAHRASVLASLEQLALQHLITNTSVIIDACSTQATQRTRWRALAHKAGAAAHLVIIHCPVEAALARAASRPGQVPARVINTYRRQMDHALRMVDREPWSSITHCDYRRVVGVAVMDALPGAPPHSGQG